MNIIRYQYVAKFVCGSEDGKIVAPGRYWTALNVHNPSSRPVKIQKKFSVALPGERAGKVTQDFYAKLGPYESMEIDCPDIIRHLETRARFVKGFAILTCDYELEVVAVYTAAGQDGMVETIDVERVSGRKFKTVLPELVPVKDPQKGWCVRDEEGNLIVMVRNEGSVAAGPSATEVDFGPHGKIIRPTPPIAAGQTVEVKFPIPRGCFNPDCGFKITVDVNKQVMEYTEGNNTVTAICIG